MYGSTGLDGDWCRGSRWQSHGYWRFPQWRRIGLGELGSSVAFFLVLLLSYLFLFLHFFDFLFSFKQSAAEGETHRLPIETAALHLLLASLVRPIVGNYIRYSYLPSPWPVAIVATNRVNLETWLKLINTILSKRTEAIMLLIFQLKANHSAIDLAFKVSRNQT